MKCPLPGFVLPALLAAAPFAAIAEAQPAAPVVSAAARSADALFDDTVLHDIYLELHRDDWTSLHANYLSNAYYPGSLRWRDVEIEDIGVRSRGFGSRSAVKPGLRVDFNRYEAGQGFLGLKSIVLDNSTQARSMIVERASMLLFQRMGLPAPRMAHARLHVNGQYAGLYAIIESVDQEFLRRNFGQQDGHLYEYDWANEYRFEYRGRNPALYSPAPFKPETHERDSDPRPIEAMVRTINEAPDGTFLASVSEFVDLPRFLLYLAVENFIAEIDGITGEWGMNNFYLYRFEGGNRFEFIPWDKDVVFTAVDHSIWKNTNQNVLVRRLLAAPEGRLAYLAALALCVEAAGGEGGWLAMEIDRAYEQVREAALKDPAKPYSNADFEGAVRSLRDFAAGRAGSVRRQLVEAGFDPASVLPPVNNPGAPPPRSRGSFQPPQ